MVFTGNAISAWYVLALHENPPVSWADPFYLADSLLTLTALLSFPLARRTRLERWKFVLDAAMVLVGGGVAIWYFSVRPTAASQESSVVVTLLAFAYPLASMLVLLGVTTVLLRRPIDGNRLAFGLLVTRRVGRRRRRPHVQPGAARGRRPERELGRRGLPGLLRAADRAAPSATGAGRWPGRTARRCPAPGSSRSAPCPTSRSPPPTALLLLVVLQPLDRSGQRARDRRAAGDGAGGARASSSRCGRTCGSWPSTAARQNEARFRSLVQHSSDVIMVTRPDGTIRFVSPSASRVFGYDPAAMIAAAAARRCCTPRIATAPRSFFARRGGGPGRDRPGGVALPPGRRLVAPRRDPGDQPAARPDGARASCSTPAT